MFVQQITATAVTFTLIVWRARVEFHLSISPLALGELWPIAGRQVLSILVLTGRYRVFVVVLGMVVTGSAVAVSNVAFRLVDSAPSVVWGSVTRLSLPRLAALQHDRLGLAMAYGDLAQLQALLGMPLAVGIALTAPDLVQGLLGPAWASAADAAMVAGLAAVVTLGFGDAGSLFVAIGRARINLFVALAQLIAPIALLLLLRPATPAGIAGCWAATSLIVTPCIAWLALRQIGRSPLWLLRCVGPGIAATAAMAAAVLTLQRAIAAPPQVELAAAAVVGAAVFGLAAWPALGRQVPRALLAPHAVAVGE